MVQDPGEIQFIDGQEGISPKAPDIGCFQCGWCCRYYQIFVTFEEATFIAQKTGCELTEVAYFTYDLPWFGEENLVLLKEPGGCIFLKHIGTKRAICGIHGFKPDVCRKFRPGLDRSACIQGLADVWGLIIGRSGQIEGEDSNLRAFSECLESIKE